MKIKCCWSGGILYRILDRKYEMDGEILPLLILDLGLGVVDGVERLDLKGQLQDGRVVGRGGV